MDVPSHSVNAEVNLMGVVDHGSGVATNLAPQLAVIEETTIELKQRYVSHEEAKRELYFLEKGGNPLDFRAGSGASLSVQSTSLAGQHHDQLVTSEAKDGLAVVASPGDSVDSSGRPRAPPAHEPNSADNLMLFDGHNDFLKGARNSIHSPRRIISSEKSCYLDGIQNTKDAGESAFGLPRKAYRRRNRSRTGREVARSNSTEVVSSRGVPASLPSRCPREAKGLAVDGDSQKDYDVPLKFMLKSASPNYSIAPKVEPPDRFEVAGDFQALHSTGEMTTDAKIDANASNGLLDDQHNHFSESDAWVIPINTTPGKSESDKVSEQAALTGHECTSLLAKPKVEDQVTSGQMNGFSGAKGDRVSLLNEYQNSNAGPGTRGLDSESSCNQTSLSVDGNIDSEICTNLRTGGSNRHSHEEIVAIEETPNIEGNISVKENNESKADDICGVTNDANGSFLKVHQENGSNLSNGQASKEKLSGSLIEMKDCIATVGTEPNAFTASENERKTSSYLGAISIGANGNSCNGKLQETMDSSIQETLDTKLSSTVSAFSPERQTCPRLTSKLATKEHEDSILEEARIIEAKRKRITELSDRTLAVEDHRKSHWDFVLEEMAWLANDFAQERLWKISAAAQISHQAAASSRLKFHEQRPCRKQKEIAHNLAKSVVNFWHCIEETNKDENFQKPVKDFSHEVQGYALRFLQYNTPNFLPVQAESPVTPDRISDYGILDMSWEIHLTEENLFYSAPAGAMEAYRKSIESGLLQYERTGIMQEGVETSRHDVLAELGLQENAFEEEEGETNTYYLPGAFDGSKSTKFVEKKRKHLMKAFQARSYELGSDSPILQCTDNKVGNLQSVMTGKRCANTLNVSIPTKRMRTASRQRVLSHFNAGTSGCVQATDKTDASSGDTNSFQDDQSTFNGLHLPNNLEVESLQDFDKQLLYDSAEISRKPKKKKKANTLGTYEHRWEMNSSYQNEQKGNFKRRLDNNQLESNGSNGLYIQQVAKKAKMMKQSLDNTIDNLNLTGGSAPSPVASQMSNMSNPNKFIRMLGGRERGRRTKTLKAPAGQTSLGNPWSLFEDQALVVLVHDMGPNWEFVSDAISSTSQFKCIFRKPKECKERHKVLMDSPAGDGADSAEDSGSSQPYRSTLPGIPKGSARQLFQHLQGPMEETTIKSHLEKIILLGKKLHRRTQEPKQLQLPHNSHVLALSQVCPNNISGGPVLTPLDLCDATTSSPDVLTLGYQSPHSSALPVPNHGIVAQILPASGVTASGQASSNVVLGSNSPSPGPPNASVRSGDGRFGIPRSATISIDEQQRIQQYNQLLSGRNIQQSSMPVPGVHPSADRGVCMLASGNGVASVCGLSRNIPQARPGLQGITSSSMLNSGSMLSSGVGTMPNPVNIHSGSVSCQGNSMARTFDSLHLMRPTQNPDHQRQMMIPELLMHGSQGSSHGVSPFGGLSSSPNQTAQTPGQPYPLHHSQPHPASSQQSPVLSSSHLPHLQVPNQTINTHHQAYALRLAKEKHIQQQRLLMQQQQQQYAASSAIMPLQGQFQLPPSSPQNTSQVQPQTSPPVSLSQLTASSSVSPTSQHSRKHHIPPHGVGRNPQVGGSGINNQMGKQRQRQPQKQQFQQAGTHHSQQRQQSQSPKQAKIMKGTARGNIMVHQNLPMENAVVNGLSTASGSQSVEKGEQVLHIVQGQGLSSGSGVNCAQSPKQLVPCTSQEAQPQQELYTGQATPSHSGNSSQNHVLSVIAGPTLATAAQTVAPPAIPSSKQKQQQSHPQHLLLAQSDLKIVNQTQQNVKILVDQNCQGNSDAQKKLQDLCQSDSHPVNNSSHKDSYTSVQGRVDTENVMPLVSSSSTPQRKAPETVYDSPLHNRPVQLGSIGSPPLTNCSNEHLSPVGQGLVQKQSSGSLTPVTDDSGEECKNKQPQQQEESQKQQKTQILREGSDSLQPHPSSQL